MGICSNGVLENGEQCSSGQYESTACSATTCSGTNGESVSFFRTRTTNLLTVSLRAQGKTFAPPLSSGLVTVTLSLDGTDQRDQANCSSLGARHGAATCRK